jgi:hypothetical protein
VDFDPGDWRGDDLARLSEIPPGYAAEDGNFRNNKKSEYMF